MIYSEIKAQKKESGPNLDPVEKLRVKISALRLSLQNGSIYAIIADMNELAVHCRQY
jgi:hypothetical protein